LRKLVSDVVLVTALLAASPCGSSLEPALPDYQSDPRLGRLKRFLQTARSPLSVFSEEFLYAADIHGIDWRLLPSISLIESGGGRRCSGNNIFGWDSGRRVFSSVREAIHLVAGKLATSKLYKNKRLLPLLRTYNSHPGYPARVAALMHRLSPTEQLAPHPSSIRMAK